MRAPVDEDADRAVGVSGHDDGLTPHASREEVTRPGDLALVAEDEPRAPEDAIQLEIEQRGIGVDRAMDTVGLDQLLDGLNPHGSVL
jgi:hypothetical protein